LLTLAWAVSAQSIRTLVADPAPSLSITDAMRAGSGRNFSTPGQGGVVGFVLAAPQNRVSDARRLPDGRIVVAMCGNQLRTFDTTGRLVAQWQMTSEPNLGPMRRIFPAGGDTIAAFEAEHARLIVFTGGLEVLRIVPLPESFGGRPLLSDPTPRLPSVPSFRSPLDVIGRLADGRFVGRVLGPPSVPQGVDRQPLSVFTFDELGKITDSLPPFRGPEVEVARPGTAPNVRFGRTTVTAVVGDRVFIGEQDQASIGEYNKDLRLVARLPTITAPEVVTDAARAAWVAAASVMFADNGTHWAYGPSYAGSMPAYGDLVAGSDGRLWVQDPSRPGTYPLVWTAYEGQRAVARAELPPRFFPTEFGPDWVLGVAFDARAAQFVQLLRLRDGALSNRQPSPLEAKPPDRPRCDPWSSR
jgi:hypothetical protein